MTIKQVEEAKKCTGEELDDRLETNVTEDNMRGDNLGILLENQVENHEMIMNNTEVDGEDIPNAASIDITNEFHAQLNPPCHLKKAEKDLLMSCTQDQSFKKMNGNLDWDRIEQVFAIKADGYNVFKRDRKRLRSTSKYFYLGESHVQIGNSTTTLNSGGNETSQLVTSMGVSFEEEEISACHVTYENTEDMLQLITYNEVMNSAADQGEDTTQESIGVVGAHIGGMKDDNSNISIIAPTIEPKRRLGSLNDLEREFVKSYGKKCMIRGKNIDNSCMLKEYKYAFPGFTRDGDILKKCWNNWKKDSPAYKEFVNSLKK